MNIVLKMKNVAEKYGFEIKEAGEGVYLMAKNTDGHPDSWIKYNPVSDMVSILGNTDHLNIWLYKTRPDLTGKKIIAFVLELSAALEMDEPIRLRDMVDPEDWQEIVGIPDASEDERWKYNRIVPFDPSNPDNPSDTAISIRKMKDYGYTWEGMYPISKEQALDFYQKGKRNVFVLNPDDTDTIIESLEDFDKFDEKEFLFGVENETLFTHYKKSLIKSDNNYFLYLLNGDLSAIKNVDLVEFDTDLMDMDGVLNQVILLIGHDISPSDGLLAYFRNRSELIKSVISTAEKYGLKPSGDRIEDYGNGYLYFVMQMQED